MTNDGAVDWYDANADYYAEEMAGRPIVEWLAWPGLRSLLPDLTGKRVLDAGCGDGTYTCELARRAEDVVGVDASRELLQRATENCGSAVDFRQGDLREPLEFFDDADFDVAVSQLALDHVEDWQPVFEELYRVLEPGGCAAISVSNPPAIWAKIDRDPDAEERFELDAPSYFETQPWRPKWSDDDAAPERVQKYRRPVSAQVGAAFEAGFVMDGLVEPEPTEEFRREHPETYERWIRRPSTFICYRFRKPERT